MSFLKIHPPHLLKMKGRRRGNLLLHLAQVDRLELVNHSDLLVRELHSAKINIVVDKFFRVARPFIVFWISRALTSARVSEKILINSMALPALFISDSLNTRFFFTTSRLRDVLGPLEYLNSSLDFKNLVINEPKHFISSLRLGGCLSLDMNKFVHVVLLWVIWISLNYILSTLSDNFVDLDIFSFVHPDHRESKENHDDSESRLREAPTFLLLG